MPEKLLFDQNISHRIVDKLPDNFTECKQVCHVGLNDCDDNEIWHYALSENYTIVTFDSDFFEISLINGCPPKIIWLRTGNLSTNEILQKLITNSDSINVFLNNPELSETACLEIN